MKVAVIWTISDFPAMTCFLVGWWLVDCHALIVWRTSNPLVLHIGTSIVGLIVITNFYLWTTCSVRAKVLFPKTTRIIVHLHKN